MVKGLTPFHYLMEGIVSAVVHDQPVTCTDKEFARFVPPPGQTCEQWAGPYILKMGGYLKSPTNTTLCEFCRFVNGDQYVFRLSCYSDVRPRRSISITLITGEIMESLCIVVTSAEANISAAL
jgi:ABC-type multidrug transport system permease subunit